MENCRVCTHLIAGTRRSAFSGRSGRRSMNTNRSRTRAVSCLLALGVVVITYGLFADPSRAWPNLLLDGFYVTTLGLSAMLFLATQRLTGARWSANLRRIPEAITAVLPITAVLMLLLYFGRETIFPWSRAGAFAQDPAIAGKARYLQTPWVFTRMVVDLMLWCGFA